MRGIGWGDHWIRTLDDGLVIYGRVDTLAELEPICRRGMERSYRDVAGVDVNDLVQKELDQYRQMHAAGMRYGRCFSVACPEGEWGGHHVSDLSSISGAEFEDARRAGWELEKSQGSRSQIP